MYCKNPALALAAFICLLALGVLILAIYRLPHLEGPVFQFVVALCITVMLISATCFVYIIKGKGKVPQRLQKCCRRILAYIEYFFHPRVAPQQEPVEVRAPENEHEEAEEDNQQEENDPPQDPQEDVQSPYPPEDDQDPHPHERVFTRCRRGVSRQLPSYDAVPPPPLPPYQGPNPGTPPPDYVEQNVPETIETSPPDYEANLETSGEERADHVETSRSDCEEEPENPETSEPDCEEPLETPQMAASGLEQEHPVTQEASLPTHDGDERLQDQQVASQSEDVNQE